MPPFGYIDAFHPSIRTLMGLFFLHRNQQGAALRLEDLLGPFPTMGVAHRYKQVAALQL